MSVCVHTVFQAVEKEVWLDRYGNLNFKKKKKKEEKKRTAYLCSCCKVGGDISRIQDSGSLHR